MVTSELPAGRELDGFCGMSCRFAGWSIGIAPYCDWGKLNVSRASVVFFQRLPWPSPPQLDPRGGARAVRAALSRPDVPCGKCASPEFRYDRGEISTLLSIKTGGCPEDCAYCPQSAQYDTGVKAERLMQVEKVLADSDAAAATEENCKCSFLTPFKALSCSV